MLLSEYEQRISRGIFSHRSKRLDNVIRAIDDYLAKGSYQALIDIEAAVQTWKATDPKEYADRGEPNAGSLSRAIQKEGEKWWGQGRIRLVDRSSHPRYEPHIWNDNGKIQFSTNCYAYACNDPYHHAGGDKPQPGQHLQPQTGISAPVGLPSGVLNPNMTHSGVRLAVMQDDQSRNAQRKQRLIPLIRLRNEMNTNAPIDVVNLPGYYLIALVVSRGVDYHWYRQDDSGLWSHKPGHTKATNLDASGRIITDPRDCNLGIYSFSTFYYAPKGGVRTASLGDWYNPNWHA